MPPESLKLLLDMKDAAETVIGFAGGRAQADYLRDRQLRMAIERGFEIIGEALSQLPRSTPRSPRASRTGKPLLASGTCSSMATAG